MMTRSTSAVLDSQKSEHGGKQGKVVIRIQAGKVKPWELVLDSGTIYAAGFYAKSVLLLSSDGPWEQLAGFRPVPSDEARIQVKNTTCRKVSRKALASVARMAQVLQAYREGGVRLDFGLWTF